MDTKNIERKDGKVTFQVVVDAAAFEAAVNKAYLKARGRIMVPGFRKGKAPRMVIEGMYGKDVFYDDAVNALALDAFKAGITEAGDRTVGDPAITDYDVADDRTLTVSYESALYPAVTLGEYKGLTAYKAPVKVGADEVATELEAVQKRNARIVTVDRGAKDGDTVNIDFDGFRDGKRFDGGKAEGHSLVLGSGSFVPGFEDQLTGAKAGDELEVKITFPEDYAPELAGADAVFKVKVNEVQETQLPELDDEFAKDVSEFDTLEDYKADIQKNLEKKRAETAENDYRNLLVKKAAENITVDIPAVMVDERINNVIEDMARRCRAQGMTLEQYLSYMGMNEQTYRTIVRPGAENDVRTELMLEAVADAEQLEASADEVEAEYKRSSENYGIDIDRVKAGVPEDIIIRDLRMKKALDLVCDSGVATDEPEKREDEAEEKPAKAKKPAAKKSPSKAEDAAEEGEETNAAKKPRRSAKKAEEPKPEE